MINKPGIARELLNEYIEAHPGKVFTLEDVRAWGNQFQYDLNRELIGTAIRHAGRRGELELAGGKNSQNAERPVHWKSTKV